MLYFKKHKFILIFILFLFSSFIGYFFLTSADIEEWSLNSANNLANLWIIEDKSSNPSLYRLWDSITRREMLKIAMKISWEDVWNECLNNFKDVSSDDWWCKYTTKALKLWYIAANDYFRPDDNITQAESLKLIFKARNIMREENSDWMQWYFNTALSLWLIDSIWSYNKNASRWWIFIASDRAINWNKVIDTFDPNEKEEDMICAQVITKAFNKDSGECIEFPNSCLPSGFEPSSTCSLNQDLNYKKEEFVFNFGSDMNRSSVEDNFSMYPFYKSNLSWLDDRNLKIQIQEVLDENIIVTANIKEGTLEKDWTKIENTLVKTFKTSGVSKIDFISPDWEINDLTKNITVRFSKPMVSLTNLDNQDNCPIEITPNIDWKCVWITTSTFQFRPEKWFPIWALYNVYVPSSLKTISWDYTINSANVEIKTPDFKVLSYTSNLEAEDPIIISFNDIISLENFEENFEISWFSNSQLNIDYSKVDTSIVWEKKILRNSIEILPKSWSWWYKKKYTYTLKSWLKSFRWNLSIWTSKTISVSTKDFLSWYSTFIYKDANLENKNLNSNLNFSSNRSIVTKQNPNINLTFQKEIPLDKSLFKLTDDSWKNPSFSISYSKKYSYVNWEYQVSEDKKSIILNISWNINSSLKLDLYLSKVSSATDTSIGFKTKDENEVINYTFIDYKTACIEFKNPIKLDWDNYENFYFLWENDKVTYISRLYSSYSNHKSGKCDYDKNKNRYLINTRLDPDTDYSLDLKKDFIDEDNYPLSSDFSTSFHTNKALNEDKYVSLVDNNKTILVPKDLNPLWIAIKTVNLDSVIVEVCDWNIDIWAENFISKEDCKKKEVFINNLWFDTNFSVINLQEIFSWEFNREIVNYRVYKKDEDKTDYEMKNSSSDIIYSIYDNKYNSFFLSDIGAYIKSWDESLLWLNDFKTWEILSDKIDFIDFYKYETKYSKEWKYLWRFPNYKWKVKFESQANWIYSFDSPSEYGYMSINLKSWEKVIVEYNSYYDYTSKTKIFLSTDKPIYKPWETVRLKWFARDLNLENYSLSKWSLSITLWDPSYRTIVNSTVYLDSQSNFDYEFELDKDFPLWNYNINVSWNYINFQVQEYEKPDFKVETNAIKQNYLYGEYPKILVNSSYYFWAPLANWEWTYSLSSRDFYFDWWKTKWYVWWENSGFYRYYSENFSTISSQKTYSLDENWKALIDFKNQDTSLFADKSKIYSFSTNVTDINTKKSVWASSEFKVLSTDTFVWLKTDKYYYNYQDEVSLDFVSVDLDWNKVWNKDINFRVYKVDYEYDKLTYRSTKNEKLLFEKSLKTNSNWLSSINYKIQDYWEFIFEVELDNKKYKTTKTIYVSGYDLLNPELWDHGLSILSDKDVYDVWDSAEFIIQSPVTWVKALVLVEKLDGILYKSVIDINSNNQRITLPIKKEYLPNFNLSVFIIDPMSSYETIFKELESVRKQMVDIEKELYKDYNWDIIPFYVSFDLLDYKSIIPPIYRKENLDKSLLDKLATLRSREQELMSDILPNYYIWNKMTKINTKYVELNSDVYTDKNNYLPWDKTNISLNIVDDNWNNINWEAVLYVIDESLLALKDNSRDILDYFYWDFSVNSSSYTNMQNLIKRFQFSDENLVVEEELLRSVSPSSFDWDYLDFADDSADYTWVWGSLDKVSNSIASTESNSRWDSLDNSTSPRVDFRDLAYYKAKVDINNGKANLSIDKLPDNLTTWIVRWYVVSDDTKVWDFKSSFKVNKKLNFLPSIPRFFVSSDIVDLSWVVSNNSWSPITVSGDLSISNAIILEKPQTISLKDSEQKEISWKIKIDDMSSDIDWNNYFSNLVMKVSSSNLQDSVELKRKIIPYSTPEYTFTNWSTYDLSYEEKIFLPNYIDKTQWKLDVSIWATILTNLLDNTDNSLVMPRDNLYSILNSLNKWLWLKLLYQKSNRLDDFSKIKVIDIAWKEHSIDDMMNIFLKDLSKYQNTDWWMMSYEDCLSGYWRGSCSDFSLTWDFLKLANWLNSNWYKIDKSITDKALSYYKKDLDLQIKDYEERNSKNYTNIDPFYDIIWYDKDYISKYVLSDRFSDFSSFDNLSKLKLILTLQYIDPQNNNLRSYINAMRNSTIIEARWTFVPASGYYNFNNTLSSALALRVFINSLEDQSLIVENIARWLLAQKNDDWYFSYYNTSIEVIKSFLDYMDYTKELENVDFDARGYLNSKEIISNSFDDKNKFSIKTWEYPIKDYINFWIDNSLWFEKTWSWKLYYDLWLRYFLPIDKIEPRDEGIVISREYYSYNDYKDAYVNDCFNPYWWAYDDYYGGFSSYYCKKTKVKNIDPINSWNRWDLVVWELEISLPQVRNNLIVESYIPSWAELLNINLDTTIDEVKDLTGWDSYYWGFKNIEFRDDKLVLYADRLYKWTYKYTYVLKLNNSWVYHNRPAVASEIKKPEIWGRTKWDYFTIK